MRPEKVTSWRGLRQVNFYTSPIPHQRIESIVSPGDVAYDRFPDLPRG
ncbi:hypothetical protein [Streptomyces anulatus]